MTSEEQTRSGKDDSVQFSLNTSQAQRQQRPRGGVSFAEDDAPMMTPTEGRRQHITSFDGQAGISTEARPKPAKLTIPPLPNTFKDGKRYVPSFVPDQVKKEEDVEGEIGDGIGGVVKFETGMVVGEQTAGDNGVYGLEVRSGGVQASNRGNKAVKTEPHLMRNPHLGRNQHEQRETEALRDDLQHLPPESTVEEYERMPVEAFGEALLRGMGWTEGRGIGRGKKDVEAKELVRRADRLGLGADPAATGKKEKRFIKPGELREEGRGGEEMVYVDEKTGVIKSSRPVGSDAKLKKRSELGVVAGKKMFVAGGKHSGFACEVKSVDSALERATVRLLPSMETVRVSFKYLVESHKSDKSDKSDTCVKGVEEPATKKVKTTHATTKPTKAAPPWLFPNIRVRVVDKKASNGRYYLKKGTIVDVKTPDTCDVFIDDFQEIVQDLHQRQLETVIPKGEGGAVLCVAGKWKGRQGIILRRNKKSDYVACQLEDEEDILKLHLDDVCELVHVS